MIERHVDLNDELNSLHKDDAEEAGLEQGNHEKRSEVEEPHHEATEVIAVAARNGALRQRHQLPHGG